MPIKCAFVDTNGEIENVLIPGVPGMYPDRSYDQGRLIVYIDDSLDIETFKDTNTWDFATSEWVTRDAPPIADGDNEWDSVSRVWKRSRVNIRRRLRRRKQELLRACDWTQLLDAPITPVRQALWAEYRRQVRLVPETYKDVDHFDDAVWPTPPGG